MAALPLREMSQEDLNAEEIKYWLMYEYWRLLDEAKKSERTQRIMHSIDKWLLNLIEEIARELQKENEPSVK